MNPHVSHTLAHLLQIGKEGSSDLPRAGKRGSDRSGTKMWKFVVSQGEVMTNTIYLFIKDAL